jgi:hypothetical protein
MPLTVPAKEVSRRSTVPMRQIQTWTAAGALYADEGSANPGRGGSRQYPLLEVEIAALLGAVAHHGMPVGLVRSLADYFRRILHAPDLLGFRTLGEATELCRRMKSKRDETNTQLLRAWIALDHVKRGNSDAIMILYRNQVGDWQHGFIGRISLAEAEGAEELHDASSPKEMWRGGYAINLRSGFLRQVWW